MVSVGAFFLKQYITAYNIEVDEHNRLIRLENKANEIENKANGILENVEFRAKNRWDADIKELEESLDELLELYPNTEAAKKVEKLREELPTIIQAQIDIRNKKLEAEKIKNDQWKAHLRKIGKPDDKDDFWYNYFTEKEKSKLYQGEITIGDRDTMVMFLPGYYEITTSETKYGKSNQYFGRTEYVCKYSYITSHEGIIDYIAY